MCPLCGAPPEAQDHEADCDGNIDVVVTAADAESRKIDLLRNELRERVDQLRGEARRFDGLTPGELGLDEFRNHPPGAFMTEPPPRTP